MSDTSWKRPRKLDASHETDGFTCGQEDLDDWLARYALVNQKAGMATVFVSLVGDSEVAGYYALCSGGVEHRNAPGRIRKGVARHDIPVVILTRLAVATTHQGKGLGRALLRDCLRRVVVASEEVGVRALLIHAKDQKAKDFYMSFGEFEESPTDSMHLLMLMKDLKKSLQLTA